MKNYFVVCLFLLAALMPPSSETLQLLIVPCNEYLLFSSFQRPMSIYSGTKVFYTLLFFELLKKAFNKSLGSIYLE